MRAAILSDQSAGITLFLPTNDAINATFNKFGLDMKGLLQNQHLCTEILQYHILPSPIEVCPAWRCWWSYTPSSRNSHLQWGPNSQDAGIYVSEALQ